MKCIIIDDEPLARQNIEMMVKEIPSLEWCASFSNIIDANKYINEHSIDLAFLDIQMPQISGIDYLKTNTWPFQVIITTAFPQYALEGFELDVTDYLVKPIRFERFLKAVNKAIKKSSSNRPEQHGQAIELEDNCIFVRSDKKFIRINIPDVCYIEGMKDYSVIHMPGEKIVVAINLKTMLEQLPAAYFMRVSKSYVINLAQVRSIDNEYVFINNTQIPVGESYRDKLMEYITKTGVIRR
jgi:two-component system LytT family response regulator